MYTKKDLDKKVNEHETLFQFIQNSSEEFDGITLTRKDVEELSDEELNTIVDYFDSLWDK